jgi:hypothetical protein
MINLVSNPERVIEGQTLKIILNIEGQLNIKTYKGAYFNLMIKKNGSTLQNVILYPLRFNGCPLEWEVNPYSYGSDGTFNVNCIYQGSNIVLTSTTFIVEPENKNLIKENVKQQQNLTTLTQSIEYKKNYIKKQEIPIDYTRGVQILQDKNLNNEIQIDPRHEIINVVQENELVLGSKVQKIKKNC